MLPITLSPETAYATKGNIGFPGTSAQATAAEGLAEDRINDALNYINADVDVTVTAGAIELARGDS